MKEIADVLIAAGKSRAERSGRRRLSAKAIMRPNPSLNADVPYAALRARTAAS
jgi:hypothetical protein